MAAGLAVAIATIVAAVDFVPTTTTMVSVEPEIVDLHQPVTFTARVLPADAFPTNVTFRVDTQSASSWTWPD